MPSVFLGAANLPAKVTVEDGPSARISVTAPLRTLACCPPSVEYPTHGTCNESTVGGAGPDAVPRSAMPRGPALPPRQNGHAHRAPSGSLALGLPGNFCPASLAKKPGVRSATGGRAAPTFAAERYPPPAVPPPPPVFPPGDRCAPLLPMRTRLPNPSVTRPRYIDRTQFSCFGGGSQPPLRMKMLSAESKKGP